MKQLQPYVPVFAIVLLAFVYLPVLQGATWQFDDVHSIVDNVHFRDWHNIPAFFTDITLFSVEPGNGMYRPMLLLSYWATHALVGMDVQGWHLVNLFIHLANTGLMWAVFGGWPALMFAFSPLAVEPVAYVSARSDSLMVFFVLVAAWAMGHGDSMWSKEEGSPDTNRWYWASAIAYAAALLTKETAIVVPLFLFIGHWWAYRSEEWKARTIGFWYYIHRHALVSGLYLLALVMTGFLGRSLAHPVRGVWDQVVSQAKALVFYMASMCYYGSLSIYPPAMPAPETFFFGIIFGAVFLANMWAHWRTGSWVWLCGAWILVALLPVMLMPLNMEMNGRRLYLPLIGLSILNCVVVGGWTRKAVLAGSVLCTMFYVEVWSDPVKLWEDAAKKNPDSYAVQNNLGDAYRQKAQAGLDWYWPKAQDAYERALRLGGDPSVEYNNLGSVALAQGDLDRAEQLYRDALSLDPRQADALANLGTVFHARVSLGQEVDKNCRQALEWYARALDVNAFHAAANRNAGLLLQQIGMNEEAQFYLERAKQVRPYP